MTDIYDEFIERVKKDSEVSFVVAFKKNSAEEAYYVPGPGCEIKKGLGNPVLMSKIKDRLCNETYAVLKAMTMLSAYGSPGQQLVHLPSCNHILVSW